MRGVHGAGAKVHKEGLVGRHLLGVGDKADGLVHQVLGEVVALLRRLGRLHLVVVVDQLRIVLVGLAAQEAIEALKAAAQRPAVVGSGGRDLVGRGQVPLADGVGVVALLQQHLGQKAVLKGDVAVGAGIAGRTLGDAGHGVGVVVAPGQNAGARRRAERRGVHVVVRQAVGSARLSRLGVSMGLP